MGFKGHAWSYAVLIASSVRLLPHSPMDLGFRCPPRRLAWRRAEAKPREWPIEWASCGGCPACAAIDSLCPVCEYRIQETFAPPRGEDPSDSD
eukprot:5610371-Pyramimonas_sp.AAC.1